MKDTSTASSGNNYQYRALQNRTEIRCLTLSAGTESDPLTCDIRHYNLSDNPSFEAISYVWGSLVRDEAITCNDQILHITPNLQRSLRQVRLTSTARVLWVDSICINQDDDKEKGHQVSLMAQIYSKAERVLITLGADKISSTHSRVADELIQEMNHLVEGEIERLMRNRYLLRYDEVEREMLADSRWESFDYLISHPWFKRGWVVQEAALGQDVRVLWGTNSYDWNIIMRMYSWFFSLARRSRPETQRRIPGLHLDIYQRQHLSETRALFPKDNWEMGDNILKLLFNARRLELTDKRDRIYAFIGLPGFEKLSQDLIISYDKSWAQVYYDVAHWHIVSNNNLLALHYVEHDRETLASDHPSWLPLWHTRQYTEILRFEGRDKGIFSHISPPVHLDLSKPGILKARGCILDTIDFTSGLFSSEPSTGEIAAVWELWRQQNKRNAYLHFSPLLAFVNAFLAGKMIFIASSPEAENLRVFSQELFGVESVQREPKFAAVRGILDHGHARNNLLNISSTVTNRKFAVTKRGLFGLVPSAAAEGDLYSVLFGADTPFVLRATSLEGHYKLVGEGSLVSSQDPRDDYPGEQGPFLYRVGSGIYAREDWIEWGLDEEDISLC